MNCADMEKFIHVYLDREFAEADRADFEQHLAACEHCRRVAQFERTFKQQLRTGLAPPQLPQDQRDALRQRIMTGIDAAAPAAAASRIWRVATGVGAAAAAALLVVTLVQERSETPLRLSAQLLPARRHPGGTGIEASLDARQADREAVRRWYQERLGYAVEPPRFSDSRTALVGARIRKVDQQRSAQLVYQRGGREFQVNIVRPDALPGGGEERHIDGRSVFFTSLGEHRVAVFQHQGVGYTIQAPVAEGELDALIRELVAPAQARPVTLP
jgi:anti-sigma factor (TIGR02949 family)